jgi:nucleoside-diphosphate-sugar epimerase
MDILVLGGTSWLGGLVASVALGRGHAVTCLARGEAGEVPDGASFVRADRTAASAYVAVDQRWDCVIDVSRDPAQVRSALSALAGQTDHWVFVSTVSVYRDHGSGTESDALHEPWTSTDPPGAEGYPAAKVACEAACREAVPTERLLVARPGLVVGYGDRSDRFGYWVARLASVAGEDEAVLVPPVAQPVQVIDAKDLASWLVDGAERRIAGTYDAVGAVTTLAAILEACSACSSYPPLAVEAEQDWLEAQGVAPWSGPESLPLWLSAEDQAMMTRSNAAALAAGLELTPLPETVASVLAWEEARGLLRARRAGLSPEREAELLAPLFHR